MHGVPLRCAQCGHRFESTVLVAAPGDTVTLGSLLSDQPCPRCGGRAEEVSGVFTVTTLGWRRLASALRPDGVTVDDYRQLAEALADAANSPGGGVVQVGVEGAAAAAERVPAFGPLAQWIRAHPDRSIAVLSLLATVVSIILTNTKPTASPPPLPVRVEIRNDVPNEEQIHDWIRRAVEAEHERDEHDRDRGESPHRPAPPP